MAGGLLAAMGLQAAASGAADSRPWTKHLQSIVGMALLVLGLVMTRSTKAFPGWWALLPVLGAVSCIAVGPDGVVYRPFALAWPRAVLGLVVRDDAPGGRVANLLALARA